MLQFKVTIHVNENTHLRPWIAIQFKGFMCWKYSELKEVHVGSKCGDRKKEQTSFVKNLTFINFGPLMKPGFENTVRLS